MKHLQSSWAWALVSVTIASSACQGRCVVGCLLFVIAGCIYPSMESAPRLTEQLCSSQRTPVIEGNASKYTRQCSTIFTLCGESAVCILHLDHVGFSHTLTIQATLTNLSGQTIYFDEHYAKGTLITGLRMWPVGGDEVYSLRIPSSGTVAPARCIKPIPPGGQCKVRGEYQLRVDTSSGNVPLYEILRCHSNSNSRSPQPVSVLPAGRYAAQAVCHVIFYSGPDDDLRMPARSSQSVSNNLLWLTIGKEQSLNAVESVPG